MYSVSVKTARVENKWRAGKHIHGLRLRYPSDIAKIIAASQQLVEMYRSLRKVAMLSRLSPVSPPKRATHGGYVPAKRVDLEESPRAAAPGPHPHGSTKPPFNLLHET